MTTSELTKLRRALEETLAMEVLPRYARWREELSKDLADVIKEQDERENIRRANTRARRQLADRQRTTTRQARPSDKPRTCPARLADPRAGPCAHRCHRHRAGRACVSR